MIKMEFNAFCVSPNFSGSYTPWEDTETWQVWLFDLCQESSTNKYVLFPVALKFNALQG
jgi:hypothetical protein